MSMAQMLEMARRDTARLLLCLGLGLYLWLHFTTGLPAPISDDHRQIVFTESMDSGWACFGLESFGMFRPVKGLIFYGLVHGAESWIASQWLGAFSAACALCLSWQFLRRLGYSDLRAAMGALLWLYLPLNVVIFNWASALNIGFYYSFSLAALLAAERALRAVSPRGKSLGYLLSGACYLCALLSYEMALSLPCLLVLFLYCYHRALVTRQAAVLLTLIYGGLTLGYWLLRSQVLTGSTGEIVANPLIAPSSDWALSLASSVAYLEHLRFLFWPYGGFEFLIPFDPASRWIEALLAWALIAAAMLLALRRFKQQPALIFALLWSALALGTVLNVIPIRAGPLAEYYMPLAAIGWIVLFLSLWERLPLAVAERGGFRVLWLLPALLAVFGVELYQRQQLWRSERALYSAIAARTERVDIAHGRLATLRLAEGDSAGARVAIERAMEMAPDNPQYAALWLSLLSKHSSMPVPMLEQTFTQALAAFPEASAVHAVYGDFLSAQGQLDLAKVAYEAAYTLAALKEDQIYALTSLGVLYATRAEFPQAVGYFSAAVDLAPERAALRQNLKQALADQAESAERQAP